MSDNLAIALQKRSISSKDGPQLQPDKRETTLTAAGEKMPVGGLPCATRGHMA